MLETADDGDRERLEPDQETHVAADTDQRADQHAADRRQHAAERIRETDHAVDVDADRKRGLAVEGRGAQRSAEHRAAVEQARAQRHAKHHDRDQQLQGIDAGPGYGHRVLRQCIRQPARRLAEHQQHDVLDDDADRERAHHPRHRSPQHERPHRQALEREAEYAEHQDRGDHRERRGPTEVDHQYQRGDRAEHHRRTLGEIEGTAGHEGDVIAERHQAVDAAESQAAEDQLEHQA